MQVTQKLASGIIVRQDFKDCARFVMFETEFEGWEYATHGGTLFVVSYRGQVFGLTCKHVFGDFNWRQLCVTDERVGRNMAGLSSILYPSSPRGDAAETDVVEITVVRFSSDVDASFFKGTCYVLDEGTVATSREGDKLLAYGALKQKSEITEEVIAPVFAELEAIDRGASPSDPTLRKAEGVYQNLEFDTVEGMSGSPMFNATQQRLCGMTARGGLNGNHCTLWYIDIHDIMEMLNAVIEGRSETDYQKTITRREEEKR